MAEKMHGRITAHQYWNLTPPGRELHDYWQKYKTKMYNEMADSGELLPTLESEGLRLNEMIISLQQKIGLAGAWEMARAEIYDEMAD